MPRAQGWPPTVRPLTLAMSAPWSIGSDFAFTANYGDERAVSIFIYVDAKRAGLAHR